MSDTYRLQQSTVYDEQGVERTVYGVEIVNTVGTVVGGYADIFFDEKQARRFVQVCNERDAHPIHLKDLVEDALAKQYQPM